MQDPNKRPYYLNKVQKKRSWAQRNPRAFILGFTGTCLLVFFSRPIYDIFFRPKSEFTQRTIAEQKTSWGV